MKKITDGNHAEISLLKQIRIYLRDKHGVSSRIVNGTACFNRTQPASRMLLSAVALVKRQFKIVCVQTQGPDQVVESYTIKVVGPKNDEIDNEHFSIAQDAHRHDCVDGKKTKKHIPTSGILAEALDRFMAKVEQYSPSLG